MNYERYKRLIDILKNGKPHTVLGYRDDFSSAIETLLAERDAAIDLLRKTNWCNGCINFRGLRGCADNAMSVCCVADDHYQFCGLQKAGG